MKKNVYERYEDNAVELFKDNNGETVVKDKKNGKFFFIKSQELLPNNIIWVKHKSKLSPIVLCCYFFIFFLLFLLNVFLLFKSNNFTITTKNNVAYIVLTILYMCFNGVLHEIGHMFAMKFLGRKPGKIWVKFNYIFPSVYVNVNESYLLTKSEKIVVHSAGIFFNLFFNTILFCFFLLNKDSILNYLYLGILSVAWSIIYNLIPFLNSDGYKILLCLINKKEYKDNHKNGRIIHILKFINIIFSLYYLILVINDILHKIFNVDFIELFHKAIQI